MNEDGPTSKKPRTQGPFQRILPEILPFVLSYISIPHLQYRLVSKEWDNAMKLVHSLDQCNVCKVPCASAEQLRTRMQALAYPTDSQQKLVPWLLHWKLKLKINNCFQLSDFRTKFFDVLSPIEQNIIPFLDPLHPSLCYSITLVIQGAEYLETEDTLADWCLGHSMPSRCTFLFPCRSIDFESEADLTSFLCAPRTKHVSEFFLDVWPRQKCSLTVFRDFEAVSKLKSLHLYEIELRSQDAECLVQSPYLTSLATLRFSRIHGLDGMTGPDRTIGLDTIICSPIMKNVNLLSLDTIPDLGYSIIESFAQSKYLKNLDWLALDRINDAQKWSLEPLSRCDATMPSLTSLSMEEWGRLSHADMRIISSPSSQLFNRIKRLNLSYCPISVSSMKVLCDGDGLKSLKWLFLNYTELTDECLELMASAPSSRFSNLVDLHLCGNETLTNASVLALYASVNSPALYVLDFRDCDAITADVLKSMSDLPPRPALRLLMFTFEQNIRDKTLSQATEKLAVIAPHLNVASSFV